MAGNLTTVTAAIARTALPTVPRSQVNSGNGSQPVSSTGNLVSTGGQALPARSTARPVPQIDFSEVVQQLDAFVENGQRSLRFRVDDATGRTVITVVNESTQEVVRQIPPAEKLAVVQNLDRLQGRLVDARV